MLKLLLIIFGILILFLFLCCYACCVISGRLSKEEENQDIYIKCIDKK